MLDLRNSGDTAGDRSRVVGYSSFAFVGNEVKRNEHQRTRSQAVSARDPSAASS
jgi:hypothetical protein